MCLYPRLIENRKYRSNKKNGGNIPLIQDQRTRLVPVGCGNCIECRKQKAREWQVRLLEDIKENKNGVFVTLTFSNEGATEVANQIDVRVRGYELDNAIATKATRLFLERWRKKYKRSMRHWLTTELGGNGTERVHMHGIIWPGRDEDGKLIGMDEVERIWKYGFIWPNNEQRKMNYVNEATVNYVTKYVSKIDEKHKGYKSKILTSAGIGANYKGSYGAKGNEYNKDKTNETYRTRTGNKMSLPVYWRNKIYTDEEREKLWINKLDQNIRWVMGQKVDIGKGEEIYYKRLREAQRQNEALGYGKGDRDWSEVEYEKERRKLKE